MGTKGLYDVRWAVYGISYAACRIYRPRRYLLGFIPMPLKLLHLDCRRRHLDDVEEYYPAQMVAWFTQVVDSYEKREAAWAVHVETTAREGPPRTFTSLK